MLEFNNVVNTNNLEKGSTNMAEAVQQAAVEKPKGKPKKIIMVTSVVIVQLVAAYFLVGFFLRHNASDSQAGTQNIQSKQSAEYQNGTSGDPNFDHVYIVKDLIVNPAGTNGLRFLLTTIGLEVTSEETVKELDKRDVQIHDSIISILTDKTLPELDDIGVRDSLKVEIKNAINGELVTGKVLNVYFSKFIIQ